MNILNAFGVGGFMNRRLLSFALLNVYLLLCIVIAPQAESQVDSSGLIFISSDGSVIPSSAPIQQTGNFYKFTGNINTPIIIEQNHIVLDGAGFSLNGTGKNGNVSGRDATIGINVTASYVTIKNVCIFNWTTGILGSYDDNKITGNWITNNRYGIKVYGADTTISRNLLAQNSAGIQLRADRALISRNNLTDNSRGIDVSGNDHLIMENSFSNSYDFAGVGIGAAIYRNNFFKTNASNYVYTWSGGKASWDNGSEGNYWGGYSRKDADCDGIGDEPYLFGYAHVYIDESGLITFGEHLFAVDAYPLMNPVLFEEIPQPSPEPPLSPQPTQSPSPTPIQTIPPSTPAAKSPSTPAWSPQQAPIPSGQTRTLLQSTEVIIAVIVGVAALVGVFILAKRIRS